MPGRDDVPYDADLAGRVELPLAVLGQATQHRHNLRALNEFIAAAREEARIREQDNRTSYSDGSTPAISALDRCSVHEVGERAILQALRTEAVSYWKRHSKAKFIVPLLYLGSVVIALFFAVDTAILIALLTTAFLFLYLLSYLSHWFILLPKQAQSSATHPYSMGTFWSAWTDARWITGNLRWSFSGRWEDLDGYLDGPDALILFVAKRQMLILPVGSFTGEQIADIRTRLAGAAVPRY